MPLNPEFKHIEGWAFESEQEALYDLARTLPEKSSAVEVGVWAGRTFFPVAEGISHGMREGHVYAVDNWDGSKIENRHMAYQFEFAYEKFLVNLDKYHFRDLVTIFRGSGLRAASDLHIDNLCLVHLDAGDSGWETFALLSTWWLRLEKGGFLAIHDVKAPPRTSSGEAVGLVDDWQDHGIVEDLVDETGRPDVGVRRAALLWENLQGVERHSETAGHWIYQKG